MQGKCGYNIGFVQVTFIEENHSHGSDIKAKRLQHRRILKTKASLSDEAPRKIIPEFADQFEFDKQITNSETYAADYQAINRAKAKAQPSNP